MTDFPDPRGRARRWPLIGGWATGIAGAALIGPGLSLLAIGAISDALPWLEYCLALGVVALTLGAVARSDARRSPVSPRGAITAIFILGALDVTVALGCAWYLRSIILLFFVVPA